MHYINMWYNNHIWYYTKLCRIFHIVDNNIDEILIYCVIVCEQLCNKIIPLPDLIIHMEFWQKKVMVLNSACLINIPVYGTPQLPYDNDN